jgi:hypothetical protein
MLKNKLKLTAIIFAVITLITTFSFAENEVSTENSTSDDTSTAVPTNETENSEYPSTTNQNIYEGDLYIFESDITMDKLVDGNVYLFGDNIKVTGQIAGNLYAFGKTVTLDKAVVQASAYIFAQDINFSGVASDLYAACSKLEIANNFGVYRDLRVGADTVYISGIIGRDAYVTANNISLEKDGSKGSIYNNFNYSSKSEINIPEGSVTGEVKYTPSKAYELTTAEKVSNYVYSALSTILFALIIFALAKWLAPNFVKKVTDMSVAKVFLALGIGVVSIIVIPVVSIILMLTYIGIPVAFALLAIYILLLCISFAISSISIGKALNNKIGSKSVFMEFVLVALTSLILWALKLLPYVGSIISIIIVLTGFGIIITNLLSKKHVSNH